jgi:hypothetical protein
MLIELSRELHILQDFLQTTRTPDPVRWEMMSVSLGLNNYVYTCNMFDDTEDVLRQVNIGIANTLKSIKTQIALARKEAANLQITTRRK